jgi:hypothetical protein
MEAGFSEDDKKRRLARLRDPRTRKQPINVGSEGVVGQSGRAADIVGGPFLIRTVMSRVEIPQRNSLLAVLRCAILLIRGADRATSIQDFLACHEVIR